MVKWYDEIIAGGVSGMAGVIVGHPFDTVKVMMQTHRKHQSSIACLKNLVRTDGFMSLFRGIIPPLSTATAINAMLFFSYEFTLRALQNRKGLNNQSESKDSIAFLDIFIAGTLAGVLQSGINIPAEVRKTFIDLLF
jgi:solute carrier family 25 carnitine/acylcarnitine transporter 20/29